MICPRCEGQGGLAEEYRNADGWSVVGPAWCCVLCGHRWPRGTGLPRLPETPKERTRSRQSASMREVWALRTKEQRAAQVAAMHAPAIYEARKKRESNG